MAREARAPADRTHAGPTRPQGDPCDEAIRVAQAGYAPPGAENDPHCRVRSVVGIAQRAEAQGVDAGPVETE